ncbi:hypothetical protein ACN38_g6412, partial [Penicillium nordicum]
FVIDVDINTPSPPTSSFSSFSFSIPLRVSHIVVPVEYPSIFCHLWFWLQVSIQHIDAVVK